MAKGRSFVSWSLAAALASPVVVLLLVVLPKAKQIKQPPAPPKIASPKPAALRASAALPIKAIKAFAYRVESSRIAGSLSRAKAAGYRSLENFAHSSNSHRTQKLVVGHLKQDVPPMKLLSGIVLGVMTMALGIAHGKIGACPMRFTPGPHIRMPHLRGHFPLTMFPRRRRLRTPWDDRGRRNVCLY